MFSKAECPIACFLNSKVDRQTKNGSEDFVSHCKPDCQINLKIWLTNISHVFTL